MTLSEFDTTCKTKGYGTFLITGDNLSDEENKSLPIIYEFVFESEHTFPEGRSIQFYKKGSCLQFFNLCDIEVSNEETVLGDEYIIGFLDFNDCRREVSVIAR